jgi:hypothetical protein
MYTAAFALLVCFILNTLVSTECQYQTSKSNPMAPLHHLNIYKSGSVKRLAILKVKQRVEIVRSGGSIHLCTLPILILCKSSGSAVGAKAEIFGQLQR